ncbi:unnamed protein product [Brassica oleracea var. botrytis]
MLTLDTLNIPPCDSKSLGFFRDVNVCVSMFDSLALAFHKYLIATRKSLKLCVPPASILRLLGVRDYLFSL